MISDKSQPIIVQGTAVRRDDLEGQEETLNHDGNRAVSAYAPPSSGHSNGTDAWQMPDGWTIARRPEDGRMYYLELSTGRTSWTHPSTASSSVGFDTAPPGPSNLSQRPRFQNPLKWPPRPFTGGSYFRDKYNKNDMTRNSSSDYMSDTPYNASKRPESHQCCAACSCLMAPPCGLCALYHSQQVAKKWDEGRYGDASDHSKQAYNYACCGIVCAILLFLIWFLRNEERRPEWMNFNFQEWFNFDK